MICQFSANLRKESVNKGKMKGLIFNRGVGEMWETWENE